MGKGRYLKAAERACVIKARFETRAAAEAFVERRYRAYRCVVCGGYHLTSGRGDRPESPEPIKREAAGPKLGDLDWSAVLNPPEAHGRELAPDPLPQQLSPEGERDFASARCVRPVGRDGRVLLVVAGRLVKSRPVAHDLRGRLEEGVEVEIEGEPPTVVRLRPAG